MLFQYYRETRDDNVLNGPLFWGTWFLHVTCFAWNEV